MHRNSTSEHTSCHQYFWVLSLGGTEIQEWETLLFVGMNLRFVLLRDRSSCFPENSGGIPCSATDESFYLLKNE